MKIEKETAAFAKKLVGGEFGEFYIYPMHDETIDKIWADEKNHQLLDDILYNDGIDMEAKFLASTVFFKKDILFMQRHAPDQIAGIYAQALVHNYTGMANSWGLLYEHKDDGPAGIAFLVIGQKAVPVLAKLLDDGAPGPTYQGSIEATVGNAYRFRIKDFAAYYIGRILNKQLKYYTDLTDRDQQIEELKKSLKPKL
jgi:hypothetical protein